MINYPNAKINLGLHITQRLADGYHNIQTVFMPIPLYDILEIITTQEKTEMSFSGIKIEGDVSDNLCMKAYQVVKRNYPSIDNVKMHLHKTIPMGAGLGGGSSDAAHTLLLLNTLFELKLNTNRLIDYCNQIGSDCSFFIHNTPLYATEKGNVFSSVNLNLQNYKVVVIKPDIHISTAWAYSRIVPKQRTYTPFDIVNKPIETWKQQLVNDFEEPLFLEHSQLKNIKKQLYDLGAVYASMTGSGSALFGLFQKPCSINFQDHFGNQLIMN